MKTLYLECLSGISGDMAVAALLDLGADEKALRDGLAGLGVDGYHLHIGRVQKSGIDACDFHVHLEHGEENAHEGEEPHGHGHGGGHIHEHRNLADIVAIIDRSALTEKVKRTAKAIFRVVAEAEAKVHGKQPDEVHFHEVGAVDSIVDIVGVSICLNNIGAERVVATPLREGTGTVRCRHGVMPVPAPATFEIARAYNIPLVITENAGEMVTPTGAAIVASLVKDFVPPEGMRLSAVGYGAGKKDFAVANVLRASLWEDMESAACRDMECKLESNLDDMTPEALAYACEKLRDFGALDVWTTPVSMKKGRLGAMLSVLIWPEKKENFVKLLLRHTSTIGVRESEHRRYVMERQSDSVETGYGPVQVKRLRFGDVNKVTVEYESAKELAQLRQVALEDVFRSVYRELEQKNGKPLQQR